jgi:hypothetical protein
MVGLVANKKKKKKEPKFFCLLAMVGLVAPRSRGKKQKKRKMAPPSITDDKECLRITAPTSTKKKGIEAPLLPLYWQW